MNAASDRAERKSDAAARTELSSLVASSTRSRFGERFFTGAGVSSVLTMVLRGVFNFVFQASASREGKGAGRAFPGGAVFFHVTPGISGGRDGVTRTRGRSRVRARA